MYTEILKIIEGGLVKDKEKVYNYAKVLADNIQKSGDEKFSKKIKDLLSSKKSQLMSLDEFSAKPIDQESRMDIIDISYPQKEFDNVIINKYVEIEIEEFINSYKFRDKLFSTGIDFISSLLLYGPPGCGKTTIANYISYKTKLPLVTTNLDVLVSSLLGSTSKNIRKAFDYASKRECILFLDEFDVIAKIRDDKHELGELKRVVNSLIQNIDSFNRNSILIAATNHHKLLDQAIWRRFSQIITLKQPSNEQIPMLLKSFISTTPNNIFNKNKKLDGLVEALSGLSHADIKTIVVNSIKKMVLNHNTMLNNWNVLQESYFYKNHNISNEEDFLGYLIKYGVTQNEINENFGFSLRKIRESSKSD